MALNSSAHLLKEAREAGFGRSHCISQAVLVTYRVLSPGPGGPADDRQQRFRFL
jgi:hypothetical protein